MRCNLTFRPLVQLPKLLRRANVAAALVVGLSQAALPSGAAFPDASGGRSAMDLAEMAVEQIQAGETASASVTLRQALDAEPGSPLLYNLCASLLLLTGDTTGATSTWSKVLQVSPGDSLAIYGLGLTSLAAGDLGRALDRFEVAQKTGDHAACLLASRYVEMLQGARGGGTGLVVPDSYSAAASGISGMAAYQRGDSRRALADLTMAVNALPGDRFAEPFGLVMTFRKQGPIKAAAQRLPLGHGLAFRASAPSEKVYSGVVTLKPDSVDSDTGYVTFKVDGEVSSIVNTSPYSLVWDTTRVSNGLHKIELVVFDRQGREFNRASKELRTFNANAPSSEIRDTTLEARKQTVRGELWRSLTLMPGRLAMATAAAASARAVRDTAAETRFTSLAAALDPKTAGARERWLASLGTGASAPLFRGAPIDNAVALTFDDGPKPGVTELLVNVLKQENVPATFFVIGRHAAAHPELIQRIAGAGFEIENHTYTHSNLTMLSPASVEKELLKTIAAVQVATGRRMRYFRPPGGNLSPDVTRVAAQWGLTPCMWTVTADALEYGNGDALVDFVVKHAQPGGIIILHNGRPTTVEALPRIIAGLRQRGFSFATVEQLAQRKAAFVKAQAAPAAGTLH